MLKQLWTLGICLVIAGMLIGCTMHPHMIVLTEYKDLKLEQASLAVLLDKQEIEFENESSLNDDFGPGNPKDILVGLMDSLVTKDMLRLSKFQKVSLVEPYPAIEKEAKTLNIGKNSITYDSMPKAGKLILVDSVDADYVLFVEDFLSDEETIWTTTGTPPNEQRHSHRYLVFQFEFFYWDNLNGKLVAHGHGRVSHEVFGIMTQKTWTKALAKFAYKVLDTSPFMKPLTDDQKPTTQSN